MREMAVDLDRLYFVPGLLARNGGGVKAGLSQARKTPTAAEATQGLPSPPGWNILGEQARVG
jgi:hypothetical protein